MKKPRRRSKSQATLLSSHEDELARRAAQLVNRVVLPDEWYLVRWGGTRKGSGSFYTRPGLTVPTVQRTLRPLAYDPPLDDDGEPDREAPPADWTPKRPEDILGLKVCDPACGSGSFPLAALRFLTDALYASLRHHGRIEERGDISLVRLLGLEDEGETDSTSVEQPGDELIPCPLDADDFEPRLRAVLRRYVVERCIYGVDVDPLAVSLCQLSLWIETMDRDLPFSFLDHKIRCGNSLIGAWFDQFQHYPAMAWKNREAGDKNHSNGVHYQMGAQTKAIKEWVKNELTPDLRHMLEGRTLFHEDLLEEAAATHGAALEGLEHIHLLPIQDSAERARLYRDELIGSDDWRSLKNAMDLWCACWFWPADELDCAPRPTTFTDPGPKTRAVVKRVAARMRFFHWELEFPDVFREEGAGFHAMLGNPPWENFQPNPEEFFSNEDPLFRSYGRLVKKDRERSMFSESKQLERRWLDYFAQFRAVANWVGNCADPFGDPASSVTKASFPLGRGGALLHERWRKGRLANHGYSDTSHVFRLQMGRIFSYKLFLEQALALLKVGGRCGLIIPSGIYSDAWSQPLRDALLENCSWEWLFGFENRAKLFPIDSRFKFNPVIVEKGGTTAHLRTVFMRRDLTDWERAEGIAVHYDLEQVHRFSPKSRAILEIESHRDLEILERIYANSILLGDDGPDGWAIRYKLEFMMNTDARLFPPRSSWEAKGYRPDEYNRWLLGNWRPVEELWAALGVDAADPKPAIELEDWLYDSDAKHERRQAERTFIHGHLLAPGDVLKTCWQLRCAQPPYDHLPVPRGAIPEGIILSREADTWIEEKEIKDVALPLYEGKMIYVANWAAATGADAATHGPHLNPNYLLGQADLRHDPTCDSRLVFRDISNSTNERSFVPSLLPGSFPCGNPLPILELPPSEPIESRLELLAYLASLTFDWATRQRMAGTHLNWHIAESLCLPRRQTIPGRSLFCRHYAGVALSGVNFAADWLRLPGVRRPHAHTPSPHERLRRIAMTEAVVASVMHVSSADFRHALADCDRPPGSGASGKSRGFWRVDKDKPPELRQTVLSQVAFADLQTRIEAAGNRQEAGIESFLGQNQGEGWLLPDTLRLADYDLGHGDRAREHRPVATELGPRFYDWQLAQPAGEAWVETHLHARNLLGEHGYRCLLAELAQHETKQPSAAGAQPLSEVAEERHGYDEWLDPLRESGPKPRKPAPTDQTDLFD